MASIFPPIPRFIFTIFEPLSLLAGFASTIIDPEWFITEQVIFSPPEKLSANAIVVALQLGNVYLLLAMVGIAVLYATTERKVVRNYMVACLIADIGHLAATYYILGYLQFVDISKWNALAWGNIGVTAFLLVSRMAYLSGLFGPDQDPAALFETKKRE